jgi:hypothetical protein
VPTNDRAWLCAKRLPPSLSPPGVVLSARPRGPEGPACVEIQSSKSRRAKLSRVNVQPSENRRRDRFGIVGTPTRLKELAASESAFELQGCAWMTRQKTRVAIARTNRLCPVRSRRHEACRSCAPRSAVVRWLRPVCRPLWVVWLALAVSSYVAYGHWASRWVLVRTSPLTQSLLTQGFECSSRINSSRPRSPREIVSRTTATRSSGATFPRTRTTPGKSAWIARDE